jgi:Bacterial sugar transferase
VGQVARIPDAEAAGHWTRPARERVVHAPATTARLIPGSGTLYAAGAKKPPQSVAAGESLRASALRPKSSRIVIATLAPAFLHHISPRMLGMLLMDASILCATFLVGRVFLGGILDPPTAAACLGLFLAMGMQEGLYGGGQKNDSEQFLLAKTSVWASIVTVLLLQRTARGAAAVALFSVASFGLMSACRWIWERAQGSVSPSGRNVLVVGDPARMQAVADALQSVPGSGRWIKGLLPDWQLYDVHGVELLRSVARKKHIDEVVLASRDPDLVGLVLSECSRNSLDLLIAPELPEGGVLEVENIAGVPLIKIREQLSPGWRLAIKRVIDAVLAPAGLALLFPLMCIVAVAIKLDSRGPVLYRAPRIGRKGRLFTCHKFRTMVQQADRAKDQLRSHNERQGHSSK